MAASWIGLCIATIWLDGLPVTSRAVDFGGPGIQEESAHLVSPPLLSICLLWLRDALSFQRKGKGGRKEIGFLRGTNETYECPEENKQFAKWNGYINVTQVPDL